MTGAFAQDIRLISIADSSLDDRLMAIYDALNRIATVLETFEARGTLQHPER